MNDIGKLVGKIALAMVVGVFGGDVINHGENYVWAVDKGWILGEIQAFRKDNQNTGIKFVKALKKEANAKCGTPEADKMTTKEIDDFLKKLYDAVSAQNGIKLTKDTNNNKTCYGIEFTTTAATQQFGENCTQGI
ncbi:hypothetical protein FACS189472_09310 [Alphaproteobacteria bacterium]|nr:hypothetical protein FACS189472_09310 [Alphaproteobacteria bacterium]